jgi:uncharacterized membrane protein YhaH (DUF805 family)
MNYYFDVLKRYADFNGRTRRKEFWMFFLFHIIITYTLLFVGIKMGFELLSTLYSLVTLLPYLGVLIRRMHDVGKSGWFCLIPIYNIVLACTDSDHGQNEYGENPKGLGNDEIGEIGKFQE